jgi:pyruvate/2-oxoglutarate dehydrogenase complex dihydrolipoamide acyltransferase (E2) component
MTDLTLDAQAWQDIDPATEALVDKWLVAEGGVVRSGQTLAQMVLVKASLELVAPAAGRIEKILVPAGQTFARGKPVAVLREAA